MGRFEMRAAFALRIISGKNIYNFAILENLRIFQNCLFTGGVVTESSICSAAAGNEPSQAHCVRQLPRKGELFALTGRYPKLPLRGSWHAVRRD